jgi:hypothetical protein
MSVVVKTLTPLTEQDVLIEALSSLGVDCQVRNNRISTNRSDSQGVQYFELDKGVYRLTHDSDELWGRLNSQMLSQQYSPVKIFLGQLEGAYKKVYQAKLLRIEEAERLRLEQERLAQIEATRSKAIAKAKQQGFAVKESRSNGKIKLVLTRTSF